MIAAVSGVVQRLRLDAAVVTVGGVGLLVHASPRTLAGLREGQHAELATSLVVREESLTLYGFADDDERATFETLQTVSGIGPRLALAMLAVHEPEALRRAVATEDLTALRKVPGVGLKGAQRMVLELKGKIGLPGAVDHAPSEPAAADDDTWRGQVREALVGLGWAAKAAEDAVAEVAPAAGEPVDVPAVLRAALQRLGRT
ncbi:Holliday junction branch migration protein RuvA [Angustibacter sp. Root456]|uniref:Holliday junction branch migration protein RuvA n=1 Tax=Angustibacter sp. Root456 TaxID=1736539 RepID=UPI0006FC0BB5|nr:ATP-dependent DNA helicase RuvA [Angustibacter sp. Root456]